MQSAPPPGPVANSQARPAEAWKLRIQIGERFLRWILLGTMLMALVAFLAIEPDADLSLLLLSVGAWTIVSIVVAWPLVLGVLLVALTFATSVSRHPHLWSAASVVAMTLGSFAFVLCWGESPRHVSDLTSGDWILIYLSISPVAAAAVVFSAWSVWSPFGRGVLSSIEASNKWIRRSQDIAVALLGMAAIVIGALCLKHLVGSDLGWNRARSWTRSPANAWEPATKAAPGRAVD